MGESAEDVKREEEIVKVANILKWMGWVGLDISGWGDV